MQIQNELDMALRSCFLNQGAQSWLATTDDITDQIKLISNCPFSQNVPLSIHSHIQYSYEFRIQFSVLCLLIPVL